MKLRITQQTEEINFYGHGKLLLTGEYFVLDGALALAVPTKFGQRLRVKKLHSRESTLFWIALDSSGKPWLQLTFETDNFTCLNANSPEANALSKILCKARELNPEFLKDKTDLAIETKLEFLRSWGLGSSSTLIYCMAKWAQADGYKLLQNTLGGSGYDVACAEHGSPILYQIKNNQPEVLPVHWKPAFTDKIYFAHLGKKQSSPDAIKNYRQHNGDKTHAIHELSRIAEIVLTCNSIEDFEELMIEHETIVGSYLKQIKIKDSLFANYWGAVKSLGAWGGDFVMLTNNRSENDLKEYLAEKNITTVFTWEEIIFS